MFNARLDLCLNAGCGGICAVPSAQSLPWVTPVGYLALKCFHLTGQTCCWLSESLVGTGRAGRGVGQQLSPLHVPGCPRREGWFCRAPAPELLYPSLMECALPCPGNPSSHSARMKGEKIDTSGPKPSLGLWAEQLCCIQTDPSAAPRPLCWVWAALRLS